MATHEHLVEATKPWNYGKKVDWNPDLHPRDRLGRFRDVFKSILKLLEGDYMDLKDVVKDAPHIKSAYVWRTKEGWEIRGSSDSGTYGIIVTPEQLDKDKHIFEDMLKTLNADPPFPDSKKCGCGCGSPVKGNYLPGHDARHKSNLVKAALLGDEEARATLAEKGWLKFLEKTPEKKKPGKEVAAPPANEAPDGDKTPDNLPGDEPDGLPDEPMPDEFQDQIPPDEEQPPPPTPDEAGWEPSDEELDIIDKEAMKDLEEEQDLIEEEEITEDRISEEYSKFIGEDDSKYSPDKQNETNDSVAAAVDGNNDEYADIEPYPDLDTCNCGCGQAKSATAKYLPGHDSRHKSALVKAAREGDKRAYVTLAKKGWLKFLDKGKAQSKPSVESAKDAKGFTQEELEYDPSRVPAGMPISDDYANYQLLDPGPGTLDEKLERLTKRRDESRSMLDRAMLNETMFRLRGGHFNVVSRPSNNRRKVIGVAAYQVLAELGLIPYTTNPDDITTASGAVKYSELRKQFDDESVEKFKDRWRKKSDRDKYISEAEKLLDGQEDLDAPEIQDRLIRTALANLGENQAFSPGLYGAIIDRSHLDSANVYNVIDNPEAAKKIENMAMRFEAFNGLWVDGVIQGQDVDPNNYFYYYLAEDLKKVFAEALDGQTSHENLVKHLIDRPDLDLDWVWHQHLAINPMIRYRDPADYLNSEKEFSASFEDIYNTARGQYADASSAELRDLVIHNLAWRAVRGVSDRLSRDARARRSSPSSSRYMAKWWKEYGHNVTRAEKPQQQWIISASKIAGDYSRSRKAGLEDILLSEAPSHDITLDDQYVDDRLIQSIFSDFAPDRGRAVFMRDTPLENGYLMIHGYEQEAPDEEKLEAIRLDPGKHLEGRGRVAIDDQADVERRLFELGAEIKPSSWSYTGNKYGGWNASGMNNAETKATSIQIDLGDGKKIEYVPDVDIRPKGATGGEGESAKSRSDRVKKWIDDNIGDGPFFAARVIEQGAEHYEFATVVFNKNGDIVQIDGSGTIESESVKRARALADEQGTKYVHNPTVSLSSWQLNTKAGSLLFRTARKEVYENVSHLPAKAIDEYARDLTNFVDDPNAFKEMLAEKLGARGLTLQDFPLTALTRNEKLAKTPSMTGGISYKRFDELFLGGTSDSTTVQGIPDGSDTSGFRYNIRSQRRTIKFTGMSPEEMAKWFEEAFGGSAETKVPYHQIFGGGRRVGKPNILLDEYADGSVKPDFGDLGVVHRSNTEASGFKDIMESGSILSISEKVERARHGRKVHGGASPQGDIGSGIDEFAFASLGSGVSYIGKWSIIYRTEMALRGDTIFTGRDFGGGSDRFNRYNNYMRRYGGTFGYGLPVSQIASPERINASDFQPGSNEINFKQELAHEDIAAVVIPAQWAESQDVKDGIAALKKVNPDVKIIFGPSSSSQLEVNKHFIGEYNQEHGFKRPQEVLNNMSNAGDLAVGDIAYAPVHALAVHHMLPIQIQEITPEGKIRGTVTGDILKMMPGTMAYINEKSGPDFDEISGKMVEIDLNEVRSFRKALSNYNG